MSNLFGLDRIVPACQSLPCYKVCTGSDITIISIWQENAQWLCEHHPLLGPISASRVTLRTTNSAAINLDQDIAAGSAGVSGLRILVSGSGFITGPVILTPKARRKLHRRDGGHGLTVLATAGINGGVSSLQIITPGARFRVDDEVKVTQPGC